MPEPPGLVGFVETEWARFWQGWNALSPDQQSALEGARQARQGALGGTPTINVPGWDDAIHVAPQYQPTRADRQEYQQAQSQGRPPLLQAHQVAAIERQNGVLDRMASSAQPGYSQAFGSMLTALDNIQDALSTAATLGRVAAWPALAWLAAHSPQVAAKVGSRLIPGLGWALAATDLLNLLTWLGLGGLIGYGLLCGGLRGGLPPALVQAALRGVSGSRPCGGKGAVGAIAETNPFSTRNLLKNSSKAAKKMPGFGKWLEVAQTTDQLFGRGLSFGAMYGAVMEAAYAAAAATQGLGFRVNPPPGANVTPYRGPGGGTLDYATARALLDRHAPGAYARATARGLGELRAKWQLARVLIDAPALLMEREALSDQDRAGVLVAWLHANDAIGRDLSGGDVDGLTADVLELDLSPLAHASAGVQELLARTTDGGASVGRWPIPGAPRVARGVELAELWAEGVAARVPVWLYPHREDAQGAWLGAVVNESAHRAFQTLLQRPDPFKARWAPDFVILTSLMDASRFPDVSAGPETLWSWWQGLRELVERGERNSVLPAELDASANAAGVVLLHGEQAFLRPESI